MPPTRPDSPGHHSSSSDGSPEDFIPLPHTIDNLDLGKDTPHPDSEPEPENFIPLPDMLNNLDLDEKTTHPNNPEYHQSNDNDNDVDDDDDGYIPLPHILDFLDPDYDSEEDMREGIRRWARCTRDVLQLNGLLGQDVEVAIYSDSESDGDEGGDGRRGESAYSAFSSKRFSDFGDDEGAAGAAVDPSRTSDEGTDSDDTSSAHRGPSAPTSPSSVYDEAGSASACVNDAPSTAHSPLRNNDSSSGYGDLSSTVPDDATPGSPYLPSPGALPRRNAISDATPRDTDLDVASNTGLPDDQETADEVTAARGAATSDDRQNRFVGPATKESNGKKERRGRKRKAKKHGKSKKPSHVFPTSNATGASLSVPSDGALPTNDAASGDRQNRSARPATEGKNKKKRKGNKSKSKKRSSLKHDPRAPEQNVRAARLEKEKSKGAQQVPEFDRIPLSEDRQPRPAKQKAKAKRKAIMAAQLTRELCEIIIGYQQQLLGFTGRQVEGCDRVAFPLHPHVGDNRVSSPCSPRSPKGNGDGSPADDGQRPKGPKAPGSPSGGPSSTDVKVETAGPSSTVSKAAPAHPDRAADLEPPTPVVICDGCGCKLDSLQGYQEGRSPTGHAIGVLDDWTQPSESAVTSRPAHPTTCTGTELSNRALLPDLLLPGSPFSSLAALLNLNDYLPSAASPIPSSTTSNASLPSWVRDSTAALPSLRPPVTCFPVNPLDFRDVQLNTVLVKSQKPAPSFDHEAERARNAERDQAGRTQRREAFRELQMRRWREDMGGLASVCPGVFSCEVGEWEEELEFQSGLEDAGESRPADGVVVSRLAGQRGGRRGQRRGRR